ncbi:hypothetical protein F5Y10DRAFT_272903 [Nemania abortiva]|nr:hypothetical protein F5Y10DRAFT_272903 [Nemania abortiva]
MADNNQPPPMSIQDFTTDYALSDSIDKRFERLRVERRGLRSWNSFEEDSEYLESLLQLSLPSIPLDWKPEVRPWDHFASSETLMLNLYHSTVIQRINIALSVALPGTALIGSVARFPSWGTENRVEGGAEVGIVPDLLVLEGRPENVKNLADLAKMIVVVGDAKLKVVDPEKDKSMILPGTIACLEPYPAQPVQYCIDLKFRFGFVLTNFELVLFQLVRLDSHRSDRIKTRSSRLNNSSSQHELPPEFEDITDL